jgi:hypothetical protein
MSEDGHQLFKLWPVGGRAGDLLAEYLLATKAVLSWAVEPVRSCASVETRA